MTSRVNLRDILAGALRWLADEALEKVNLAATWRELKALGIRYGRRFFIAAVLWELTEDVVFPYLSWLAGFPWLIPVFLVLHFEPIVYPIFFFVFRTWDRMRGREPWEPDRLGESTFWRTGLVTLSQRLASIAAFWALLSGLGISLWVLAAYAVGMTLFGFVHDRLWHDSNFGIDVPTDTVMFRRVLAKALTYRVVSSFVMSGVFLGLLGSVPPTAWLYQALMLAVGIALGCAWARTGMGVRPVRGATTA